MFCGIGQNEIDLTTIAPKCEYDYEDLGEGFFTIMYYYPGDGKTWRYDWNIVGVNEGTGDDVWGWAIQKTGEPVSVGDRIFSAGQGFWIMCSDGVEAPILTVAGEVLDVSPSQQYASVALIPGDQLSVLCPVPQSGTFDIVDIVPECEYEYEDLGEGFFTIMYYCPTDGKTWRYDWNIVGSDGSGNDVWGWAIQKTGEPIEKGSRVFAAGEGFWVMCSDGVEEPVIKFQNPVYSAE